MIFSPLLKPMPRFELGTSSLPRRHTARLCHIGIRVLLQFHPVPVISERWKII
jgi:hypothetical protein